MPVKPTKNEDLYIARQEAAALRKKAQEQRDKMQAEERENERQIHHMKCPRCGMPLEEITFSEIHIDKCFSCEGVWLDAGELEQIRDKEAGFLGRMVELFR